jgi:hypothetical protein
MYRTARRRVWSVAGQLKIVLAAVVLIVAGDLVVASPASAAAGLTIRHAVTYDCLDQHFDDAGNATIMVYAWPDPCHSAGNQQWTFRNVRGNTYKVVNSRWDPAFRTNWCLSAPNGGFSRVYAELCVNEEKQLWTPVLRGGQNVLMNEYARHPVTGQLLIWQFRSRAPENREWFALG